MEEHLETDDAGSFRSTDLNPLYHDHSYVNQDVSSTDKAQSIVDVCEHLESVTLASPDVDDNESKNPNIEKSRDASDENIFTQDEDGDTFLHIAVISLQKDIVYCLLGMATDRAVLDIQNQLFQTPLHLAIITNQVDITRTLVTCGADLTRQDREGNTPLHIACRYNFIDVAVQLLSPINYLEVDPVCYQVPYQRIPQDLEIRNYDGFTCLHIATVCNHLDLVDMLLRSGADVNAREGKGGRTPCHIAAETENHELLELLLSHSGCDVNRASYSGIRPLDIARTIADHVGFERMVDAGATLRGEEE